MESKHKRRKTKLYTLYDNWEMVYAVHMREKREREGGREGEREREIKEMAKSNENHVMQNQDRNRSAHFLQSAIPH